ncbi:cysteine-rich receptor-like protein kinase 2 isoform X2 [Prunus yedoensis var. nudiflora]|uniref:Cysteine-rich receptor-like protein kinase 2 isoform X2 n=1 Tax=Prunus yedoensis var. nudiflora TaxID=2094558 RepID=A0A314ZC23_PRUYE|nr:cysteine-rich receptor-like protein kinase 2 isoform X2 [Prunus yedoensis var. nudiflora]
MVRRIWLLTCTVVAICFVIIPDAAKGELCQPASCGDFLDIRYPFHLKNASPHQNCLKTLDYPAELSCQHNRTILNLYDVADGVDDLHSSCNMSTIILRNYEETGKALSFSSIHDELRQGFELSWLQFLPDKYCYSPSQSLYCEFHTSGQDHWIESDGTNGTRHYFSAGFLELQTVLDKVPKG